MIADRDMQVGLLGSQCLDLQQIKYRMSDQVASIEYSTERLRIGAWVAFTQKVTGESGCDRQVQFRRVRVSDHISVVLWIAGRTPLTPGGSNLVLFSI